MTGDGIGDGDLLIVDRASSLTTDASPSVTWMGSSPSNGSSWKLRGPGSCRPIPHIRPFASMPTTNSRSGAWCVTSSKPSNNTFDVRPLRLQQLLRLLPAGLSSRSCRATRGRAVEQRRLHHRPLERSQSPRHRHGAAALSGTGAYRPARRGRLFGQLRPLRRYVAPCDGDTPHARPLRRGVLHRRGILRPARHRRAVKRLRTSHRPQRYAATRAFP